MTSDDEILREAVPRARGPFRPPAYLGIDPGVQGGLALLSGVDVRVWAMPQTERDLWEVFAELRGYRVYAVIERVGANRGHGDRRQGASSMFTFGRNYGLLRGMLIASQIPFEEISPQTWQKEFGLRRSSKSETDTAKKNRHKAKAQQLVPQVKVIHKTADALLLAEYCRQRYQLAVIPDSVCKAHLWPI